MFEGEVMGEYFADLFVENKIIVELKACESLVKVFEVQLVNYLKATSNEVGLLINFGPKLEIKRKVNSVIHNESGSSALNHLH
jgi:GxxExxY protein